MPRKAEKTPKISAVQEMNELYDKLLQLTTAAFESTETKALSAQKTIHQVTQQLRKLETSKDKYQNCIGNRTGGDTIARFLNWSQENGALLNGCSIQDFPGYGLGLEATVDINKSTMIISVPKILMINMEQAENSILKDLIKKDSLLSKMPNVTLAIFLLLEKYKQEDSFWKPYIDILPTTYNTVLFFTPEEFEELQGSPTLLPALRLIMNITRQYAYFCKLFAVSNDPASKLLRKHFTFNAYCWAVSTVMTRQNSIPSEENFHHALIPLWDLCNHTNGTISTGYNTELAQSECLAFKDFKAGQQIFICYGERSNTDFFIHNGFIDEDNNNDSYLLPLGISKYDVNKTERVALMNHLSLLNPNQLEPQSFFLTKHSNPIPKELLAFLRVFSMNQQELQHWLNSDKREDLKCIECALDTALEKKSWGFLQVRLKLRLAAYKTSLDEDEQLIAEAKAAPNRLLAIKMRTTEKRIIANTLDYLEQQIKQ